MEWDEKKLKIAEVVLRHYTPENDNYEFGPSKTELPGVSDSMISRVAKELRLNGWAIPQRPTTSERVVALGQGVGVKMDVVKPSPFVITIGQARIELEPEGLFRVHYVYQDIMRATGTQGSLTECIEAAVNMAWRILASDMPMDVPEVEKEVVSGEPV